MFKVVDAFTQFSTKGFRDPGIYVQGKGVLNYIGKLVKRYSRKATILSSDRTRNAIW